VVHINGVISLPIFQLGILIRCYWTQISTKIKKQIIEKIKNNSNLSE
jgi:hypothetical protein